MTTRWTPAEIEMISGLAGDLPWPKVVDTYKRWASRAGMPQRTEAAMKTRAFRSGLQRSAAGQFVTPGCVSELLGVTCETVERWIKHGWLPSQRYGKGHGYFHFISRRDLQRLARKRPHLFGGQTEPTLIQLLDSEQLAQQIVAMELPLPWRRTAVVCVERGCRYESIRAAARAVFVVPQRLHACLDQPNRTAAGYHWRRA